MQILPKHFGSYQKAVPYLFAGLAILLLLLIFLIGNPLRKNYQAHKNIQQKKAMIDRAPQRIQELQSELASLTQSEIKPYSGELFLSVITKYCNEHNLRIESLPTAKYMEQDDLTLVSQAVELEGTFPDLLKLIFLLEREEKLGVINSANFYVVKDRKTKREALRLQFMLRNIIV